MILNKAWLDKPRTKAQLVALVEDVFLRLDTSNDPLTGELEITPASGATALRANKDIVVLSGRKVIYDGA